MIYHNTTYKQLYLSANERITSIITGPSITMNKHGKIKNIIGSVSNVGACAALASASSILRCLDSVAKSRKETAKDDPYSID